MTKNYIIMEVLVMWGWFIMVGLLGLIVGFVFGVNVVYHFLKVGTLRVDQSDPFDEPYLFLELSRPVSYVMGRKVVVMDVKVEDYIPRN